MRRAAAPAARHLTTPRAEQLERVDTLPLSEAASPAGLAPLEPDGLDLASVAFVPFFLLNVSDRPILLNASRHTERTSVRSDLIGGTSCASEGSDEGMRRVPLFGPHRTNLKEGAAHAKAVPVDNRFCPEPATSRQNASCQSGRTSHAIRTRRGMAAKVPGLASRPMRVSAPLSGCLRRLSGAPDSPINDDDAICDENSMKLAVACTTDKPKRVSIDEKSSRKTCFYHPNTAPSHPGHTVAATRPHTPHALLFDWI